MKKTSEKTTKPATKKATKGSTTPRLRTDSLQMNEDLGKKCDVIKGLLVASDTETLTARCAIGDHVNQVMGDEKKFGENAVGKLAAAIDRDADTLYDFAKVATLVKKGPFSELVGERSKHGTPLSFSHWVVIAKADEKGRTDLAKKALKEGWSVRTLKNMANPEEQSPAQDGVAKLSTALVSTQKRLVGDLKLAVEDLSEVNVPKERREGGRKLIGLLRALRDAVDLGIENLDRVLASDGPSEPSLPSGAPITGHSGANGHGASASTMAAQI